MRRMVAAAVVALLAPACAASGLAFRSDERVTILRPADRALVRPPVTVAWTVRDFEVTGPTRVARPDAGYFGIFVDRAPPAPGKTPESLFRDDTSCRPADGCPDRAYMADRDVYTTTKTTFTVQRLRRLDPSNQRRRRELHDVTIVLLDGRGRRIGESAYPAEFQVIEGPT